MTATLSLGDSPLTLLSSLPPPLITRDVQLPKIEGRVCDGGKQLLGYAAYVVGTRFDNQLEPPNLVS